jgi:Tfp pilus assembly protein PilV
MLVHSKPDRRGQTLIEVMMALGVATTAFLGIIGLLSKSFFYHRVTSDELTATYLASEGVEIAKNLIDHDTYAGNPWGACFGGNGTVQVELDYATTDCATLQGYAAGVTLQFDRTTDRYGYHETANSVATPFARLIRVKTSGDEITVQSVVTWSTGPVASQSINLEDHFYNWRR